MKREEREAILKERVTATLLVKGIDGKNQFVKCDITPLTEHIRNVGVQVIVKDLQEAIYTLTKYSLNDLEESGAGNGGIYHLLIPEVIDTLKFLSDSLNEIEVVQTA